MFYGEYAYVVAENFDSPATPTGRHTSARGPHWSPSDDERRSEYEPNASLLTFKILSASSQTLLPAARGGYEPSDKLIPLDSPRSVTVECQD